MMTKSEKTIKLVLLFLSILFIFFIVLNNISYADVKTKGNILLGLELKRGSSHENRFNLDGDIKLYNLRHELEIGGEANYTETNHVRSENKYVLYSTYRNHIKILNRIYWFGNFRLTRDEFNDINLRLSVGPGLGVTIFDNDKTSFYIELSPNYIHDKFEDTSTLNYFSVRWKLYISHWILDKSLKLFHQQLIFKKIETNDKTYDIQTSTGIDFPLKISSLFIRAQYDYNTLYNYTEQDHSYDSMFAFKVGMKF